VAELREITRGAWRDAARRSAANSLPHDQAGRTTAKVEGHGSCAQNADPPREIFSARRGGVVSIPSSALRRDCGRTCWLMLAHARLVWATQPRGHHGTGSGERAIVATRGLRGRYAVFKANVRQLVVRLRHPPYSCGLQALTLRAPSDSFSLRRWRTTSPLHGRRLLDLPLTRAPQRWGQIDLKSLEPSWWRKGTIFSCFHTGRTGADVG